VSIKLWVSLTGGQLIVDTRQMIYETLILSYSRVVAWGQRPENLELSYSTAVGCGQVAGVVLNSGFVSVFTR
jgi:hypothetical protein